MKPDFALSFSLEEISFLQGNISLKEFEKIITRYRTSEYGKYLKKIKEDFKIKIDVL